LWDRVIVAIYDRPSKKLMFDTQERVALFAEAIQDWPNVEVMPYQGLTVRFAREVGAKVMVRGLRAITDFEFEFQIALTNKQLDPSVEFCALMTSQQHTFLSATILKEVALLGGDISRMCPPNVEAALHQRARELSSKEGRSKIGRI
jgi:pantetheine-phosphate adenylyltransferase